MAGARKRYVPVRDQPQILQSFRRIRSRLNPDPDPVLEAQRERARLDTWACFNKVWREAALKQERLWHVDYVRYELRGRTWDQLLADDPNEWVRLRGFYLFPDDPMSEAERAMLHQEYDWNPRCSGTAKTGPRLQ
jgi:hypothetical protein